VKHTIKLTITLDTEASPGWPLKVYAEINDLISPFPVAKGSLTLTSAVASGEAVTSLILHEAKRKGMAIEEV
jgi:hypothetical protein